MTLKSVLHYFGFHNHIQLQVPQNVKKQKNDEVEH
jgi:hypothetical protein